MNDDDLASFGTALHDRVRDEHPDLDRLIRVATRAGTRIRRGRRIGVSLTVAASVGLIAAASQLGGGTDTTNAPQLAAQPPAASATTPTPSSTPTKHRHRVRMPVSIHADGWRCDPPADQKFACSKDGAVLSVNLRRAADHAAYLDPGKADVMPGVHTYVGPVHKGRFVTVAPGLGATQQDVDAVAAGIVWR